MSYYRTSRHHPQIESDLDLKNSYDSVFADAKNSHSFDIIFQKESKKLFDVSEDGQLSPKMFDLDALIVGLPFSQMLQCFAVDIQKIIDTNLSIYDRYWVEPSNLACEVCVFSWPEEDNSDFDLNEVATFLQHADLKCFDLRIDGVQIHLDGSVILRAYDSGVIRSIRRTVKNKFPELPSKQSSWAHIPLGRIVNQISNYQYSKIIETIMTINQSIEFYETISNIKIVEEHQWFMTTKNVFFEKELS